MQEGKFDEASQIWFTEKKGKPPDMRRLQGAMFMDRPDLWQKPKRNRRKRVAKEQQSLF
ncbi:unnamed protein product [marine sediment metagenome]|uniref:Uncharacterized protein n=1 Tax=marine sediment metagenome TaxID=412755 RepID=X1HJ42_9ZZZZ